MTDRGRGADHRLWSLAGIVVPMLAAIALVPLLMGRIGVERFGVLGLCMALVGYAGLLDLGLARAVTRQVADALGRGDPDEARAYLRAASIALMALGAAAGGLLLAAAPWLSMRLTTGVPALEQEALGTLRLVAVSLPLVMLSATMGGALEGMQRFRQVNALRMPFGVLSLLLPWLVSFVRIELTWVVAGLVAARVALLLALSITVSRVWPRWHRGMRWDAQRLAVLLRYGGWLTVSSIVGPLMEYLDRFWISFVLGAAAVAYYTVPYDLLTRLSALATAVCAVAFSELVWARTKGDAVTPVILGSTFRWLMALVAPVCVLAVAMGPELLKAWLGAEFADRSTEVTRWLAIGVLVNTAARVPHVFLLACGRSDWVAKLHLAELPAYLLGLWMAAGSGDLRAVAGVWVARMAVDAVALNVLSMKLDRAASAALLRPWRMVVPVLFGLVGLTVLSVGTAWRVAVATVAFATMAFAVLRYRRRGSRAVARDVSTS